MTSIRPLPEAVRSSMRSGIFLFDFTRVVEELVFNALDAAATKVSVFVSVGSCYVKVVDDGSGITRDALELVGKRYATSKFLNLDDLNATSGNFGFRGEALASISEVALLEIMTRTYGRPHGYRKLLKGCKCLYLGIDDDRKEVGTTVVVRDLFYNQPVRRKYMQSSPKKVLQSIKKCVIRLALVRPNISFKLVDIGSEDELFCTYSASSPLSLLTSGFGVEISSALHDLEVQDNVIKLSGYISGPCNNFNIKALQYVYINSHFVCKGPIHKLLSQLAIRFDHLNSWNTNNEFQNKKRSRSQPCPAYILNISCPRSLYDLTFEPSKTYVQFKDWTPILSFIEKAIKQFWEESIACGESSKQGSYVVQAYQPWKAGDNIVLAEADESKCRKPNHEDCLDLIFSTSDKLTEDDFYQSNRKNDGTSLGYLHRGTSMFKEQQTKSYFLCQTGYSGNSQDGSYAECISIAMRKHNSLRTYDNKGLLGGDYFLDEINEDFQKPFLKSCSIQGNVRAEKALYVNDEQEFQTDSFWSKQHLGEDCGCGEDLCAHSCPEVAKKFKTSRGSDVLLRALPEENFFTSDPHYLSAQIEGSGSDDQLLNSEWHPVYPELSSQVTAWDVDHKTDIDDLGGLSRHYKREHGTKFLADEENECDFSYNMSRNDFSYNMSRNSNKHHCTLSFTNTGLYFDGAADCNKIFHRLVKWPECDDIYSGKRPDISNEESDWLLPESCGESCKSFGMNNSRDHFRYPALEKNHDRSRRSFSAPPFQRNKRRFFSLNQPTEMIAKGPTGQKTSNCPFNNQEADDFKCPQQSPGALHPSTEELFSQEFRPNMKHRLDVLGDTQVNDVTEIDRFGSFNIQNGALFKDLISREVPDTIDYRTKWRNCSPPIPKNDKLIDIQSQNSILDISSGFLHLAGDSLIPETISKKCLEDAKVLHQVDKKFIPVVAGRTLAVIDQHAADERIRLEELRQKVLSGEAKAITYLDAEQELVLPEIGYQLLHSYSEQIKNWGWICNIHAQNSESFKRNLDILNRQPVAVTLIAVPCILGVNLNDADLLEFLQQLADTDGSSTMPPSVIRVLNLKACRGAIMFGDSLLPSECSLLVEELKHTSLCFQCAHGRPTTVPLVNLEALHNQLAKLGLINDCSNDKWHGLQRHKVCVERAAQRLCSARG